MFSRISPTFLTKCIVLLVESVFHNQFSNSLPRYFPEYQWYSQILSSYSSSAHWEITLAPLDNSFRKNYVYLFPSNCRIMIHVFVMFLAYLLNFLCWICSRSANCCPRRICLFHIYPYSQGFSIALITSKHGQTDKLPANISSNCFDQQSSTHVRTPPVHVNLYADPMTSLYPA